MAGFPHHQLDVQLVKLVASGRRVAICEQIDDPKTTKGLLRREVTRIVTPGIASDESLLDPQRPNYLMAIMPRALADKNEVLIGLAWIDVAAGRFESAVVSHDAVADHILRLDPSEILCSEKDCDSVADMVQSAGAHRPVTNRPDWWFDESTAQSAVSRALDGQRLEGFGFELP